MTPIAPSLVCTPPDAPPAGVPLYADTATAWVADCPSCGDPVVVRKAHGDDVPDVELVEMLALVDAAGLERHRRRCRLDLDRRALLDRWYAHARPDARARQSAARWEEERRALVAIARRHRPDLERGWRGWKVHSTDGLFSPERRTPWPEASSSATCDRCSSAPGRDCWCGIAFYAALEDVVDQALEQPAAVIDRYVWGVVKTSGRVERDTALLGASYRCEEATIEALVVSADFEHHASALEDRYGVPVHVYDGSGAQALYGGAVAQGLPAVRRHVPRTVDVLELAAREDLFDQLGGAAWQTRGIDGQQVAYVPGDPAARASLAPDGAIVDGGSVPGARFTWYRPGGHVLAFTDDECDAVLEAIAEVGPSIYGREAGTVARGGSGGWVVERIAALFQAAREVWWPALRFTTLERGDLYVASYGPGEALSWHTDATPSDPSHRLSLSVQLSHPDEYDGGALEALFGDAPIQLPRERGTAIVFPATLLHRVERVTGGTRRALVAFATEHTP